MSIALNSMNKYISYLLNIIWISVISENIVTILFAIASNRKSRHIVLPVDKRLNTYI